MVQVNVKHSGAFVIEWLVRQGYPLSLLPYAHALKPLYVGLETRWQVRPCVIFHCAGPLLAKVSVYTDDISVFVSRHMDIRTVKKAVCDVRADSWDQSQFLYERKFSAGCLEGWRFPTMAFLLECQTHPHPWDMARAWVSTAVKLTRWVPGFQGGCI